jgi:hypothetical protein
MVFDSSDDESVGASQGNDLNLRDLMEQANSGNRIGDQIHHPGDGLRNDQSSITHVGTRAEFNMNSPNDQGFMQEQEHHEEEHDNPPRTRIRFSYSPHDQNCNRTRRIFNKSTQVDLQTLEQGQELYINPPEGVNVNRMLLIGQLMWIVTPGKDENSSTYSYYKRAQAKNTSGCQYNRILFFRFCSETNSNQNNRLFCVVHTNTKKNHQFFDRFANERDNGLCTIGSLIAIVNPDPIEDYMNGTPMIVTNEKAILLQPFVHPSIPMCTDLDANESKAFVITQSTIAVGRIVFLDSACSGKFCDRQNIELTRFKGKSCGCFSLKSSRSNIISVHSITFTTSTGEKKMMSKFSSLKFMELYTKGKLSIDIRASRLQSGNDVYDDIIDCLEEIIELINADGGWVVYGWGKQGVVNDIVMLGNESNKDQGVDTKVLSEHISTHVVHMHPANIDYLDPVTVRGKQLEEFKYDFSSL